jgi:hypothetical protein
MALALAAGPAPAQEITTFGGDVYAAGDDAALPGPAPRDAFLSGFTARLDETVAGDAHMAGFDLDASAPVEGNLYAAGFSLTLGAPVGEDLTAAGFTLTLPAGGSVAGNARLAGGTVTVEGAVEGSLLASGGTVTLDGAVAGDARLSGGEIRFGDAARVGGILTYAAPERVDVPASVAPPERVRFERLAPGTAFDDWRETVGEIPRPEGPGALALVTGFLLTLAFFLAVAAAALAFLPATVARLCEVATALPGRALLMGFLGLATLAGLVPVSAMTLVGLPLLPVVVLLIIAGWTLGYLLGAYVIARQILAQVQGKTPGTGASLAALAGALVVLALLNFIPVLGWILNLAVVFLGLGAIALALMARVTAGTEGAAA